MTDPSVAEGRAADAISATLARHGIRLTLGGEPTFVPVEPTGAEWNHAAVGPTKLAYAWNVADRLLDGAARASSAVRSGS